MLVPIILFITGLVLIIKGGDWFIDSAVWIARITGLPEVLIGASIVSLGTTFPELVVSATSALQGETEMSIGNAIGSTICNAGLILGICNLISPSKLTSSVYGVKSFIMVLYLFVFFLLSMDGMIGGADSAILLGGLALYIFINYYEIKNIKTDRSAAKAQERPAAPKKKEIFINIALFFVGISLVVFGARLVVQNGISIATQLQIPTTIISLTAIALGTSLPELVTSVSALIKGHKSLAVGNIIGANILNISLVLGVSSAISPLRSGAHSLPFDIPFSLMMAAVLALPIITFRKITRIHALILLLLYAGYLSVLVWKYL